MALQLNRIQIPIINDILPIIIIHYFGYLGFRLGFTKRDELIQMFSKSGTGSKKKSWRSINCTQNEQKYCINYWIQVLLSMVELRIYRQQVLLKVILVVPQFVLTELQHIADSSDTLKRTRGRRGLIF